MKIGDHVRVIESGQPSKETAVVEAFLSDIKGGVRLDRRVNGFRFWNVLDLEKVKRSGARRAA